MNGAEVFIPIIIFLTVGTIAIMYRKFTNDERMALIEKGGDADIFKKKINTQPVLRFSLLAIGAGLGLIIAGQIEFYFSEPETAYFAMIFLCGGIGLLISYFIEKHAEKKEQD